MMTATGIADLISVFRLGVFRLSVFLRIQNCSMATVDIIPDRTRPGKGPMVPSKQSHGLTGGAVTVAKTIALILALLVASCAIPEEAFDGSLEGDYYINGVDPQGVEYSGLLTISLTDRPDTYEMQWIVTGSVQQGTGRVEGSRLDASWDAIEGYDTASYGTASYVISSNGELKGERTVAGQDGTGTEEAFPIR